VKPIPGNVDTLNTELARYRHAVLVGLADHPRATGRKQSKARNLLEQMRDRQPEILQFAHDLNVPFTNNGSERTRPATGQHPTQDQRLPPSQQRRHQLAAHPQLHQHRPQASPRRPRCAT